jgi:Flp pilus assembly protein CpaB
VDALAAADRGNEAVMRPRHWAVIAVTCLAAGKDCSARSHEPPIAPTELVMVAATDLNPGVEIRERDVVGVEMPALYLAEDAIRLPELVVGRIPRERILANEVVREARMADGERGVGVNALVPSGLRAMWLDVDDERLRGVEPGMPVDVFGQTGQTFGRVLYRLPVLGVYPWEDTAGAATASRRLGVVVVTTPRQAEILASARREGSIHLAPNIDCNIEIAQTTPLTEEDLFPGGRASPPPTPVHRVRRATPSSRRPVPPPPAPVTLHIIAHHGAWTGQ